MRRIAPFALGIAMVGAVEACSCVSAVSETAKSQMTPASLVFRGTVLESKLLTQHSEMRGRRRYAVTFRVDESWKGTPGRTVTLYDLDAAAGCMGFGYQVGKEYLVYALQEGAKDYKLDGVFWFGWTDVLAPGTPMLHPMACMPGGPTSDRLVLKAVRELGSGRVPRHLSEVTDPVFRLRLGEDVHVCHPLQAPGREGG